MLGTKCPSMTSTWIQSAPAPSTARTSSPSLAKSDARMDGAISSGRAIDSSGGGSRNTARRGGQRVPRGYPIGRGRDVISSREGPASEVRMADAARVSDLDKQSLRGFLAQVARELPDEM